MNAIRISLFLPLTGALFACGNDNESTTGEDVAADQAAMMAQQPKAAPAAVCLWDKAGLREKPGTGGQDNKYLATMVFGETVSLTGESEEVASEKRTYIEVRLSDGKQGWVSESLFALNAKLVAATGPIEVYRRPDLLTAKSERFEAGQLVALLPGDNPDWVEVYGKEKKPQGWVQKDQNMTDDKVEVAVAVLYGKAIEEKNPRKREEQLQAIAQNVSFSKAKIIGMVDEALLEITNLPPLAADQMMIQVSSLNARAKPSTEDENVVFKLSEGDICTILKKGEREKIDEMNDFWYRISFDGKEGWVYGYHTSKRAE